MPTRIFRIIKVLVLSAFFVPCPAEANDAAFWGQGATVFAVKETRVRMEREKVVIRHAPPEGVSSQEARTARWEADVRFEFQNLTNTEITVQIGFPNWEDVSETAPRGPGPHWAIRDFRVWVGDRPVETEHKGVGTNTRQAPVSGVPKTILDLGYRAAYTWDVTFPPNGLVTIRNTYRFGGFNSNGPFAACVGEPTAKASKQAFWLNAPPARKGWAFGSGTCERVAYIVTTGRTWVGPIGEADIEIELLPGTPPHLFVPVPEATEVTAGKVRWHFRNWDPQQELAVLYAWPIPNEDTRDLPAFDTVAQSKAWTRFAAANHFSKEAVAQTLAWTRAAREGRLDDPVLAPFLTRFKWYKESFTPGRLLPKRETHSIIDVIEQFATGRK